MGRKNEVLIIEYLEKSAEKQGKTGCSTNEIAAALGIKRSNISALLNSLHKSGKLIKSISRPVLYAVPPHTISLPTETLSEEPLNFNMLIGKNKSLQKCIQRAKAAILYPPRGLHTIILGPTGVGKTMFAEMMYHFSIENNIFPSSAPFIAFNCADYANNPQLLLAYLFGCKKGAFTGADRDKPGIVAKADGGILFLDEVHRLPPEGQEMLFYLIDKGLYSPLGDVDNKKTCDLLIICSTTEDIEQSLLTTFTRRIPMNIFIPALKDRTHEERLHLIYEFFKTESRRIGREILVSANVLRALLLYVCKGNVGQLKSDIQFGCANAFLKCISSKKKFLDVHMSDFSSHVKQGLLLYKKEALIIDCLIKGDGQTSFTPNKSKSLIVKHDDFLLNTFYEQIEKRIQYLQKQGVDENDIKFTMSFDIENYFKKFIRNFKDTFNTDELSQLVDEALISLIKRFFKTSSLELHRAFSAKVFYGLCLHINSSIERIKQSKPIINHNIGQIIDKNPVEYKIALDFSKELGRIYNIHVPVDEVGFITMFLSIDNTNSELNSALPIIVVATHGKSTASSMVEVAANLVQVDNLYAYDMAMDKSPTIAYEEIKNLIIKKHQGAGIILLVDMGALTMFGELLREETGFEIQTLDMVSTLLVIECARKSVIDTNIFDICEDIKSNKLLFSKYTDSITHTLSLKNDNIIIALCTTGEGSALKIKTLLEDKLHLDEKNIQVLPMSINDKNQLTSKINSLSKQKNIIAVVGSINPKLYNIPFFSIAEIFNEYGLQNIIAAIGKIKTNSDAYEQVFAAMQSEFQEMDINHYRNIFFDFLNKLQKKLNMHNDSDVTIGLIMHLICAISRMHRHEASPTCIYKNHLEEQYSFEFAIIKSSIEKMEKFYQISFSDDEIWYIFQIIENTLS